MKKTDKQKAREKLQRMKQPPNYRTVGTYQHGVTVVENKAHKQGVMG